MRNNEQGRSMIEMLGVLAIVGVLSVGGIAGYSKAMQKFKTNKLIDQVNMTATNLRTLFASQRNYSGLNTYAAVGTGAIPQEMVSCATITPEGGENAYEDCSITNAFGGGVVITSCSDTACGSEVTGADAFAITMDNIPAAACATIATTDWGSEVGSGLRGIYVGPSTGTITTGGEEQEVDAVVELATTCTREQLVSGETDVGTNIACNFGTASVNSLPYQVAKASANCGTTGATIVWLYE